MAQNARAATTPSTIHVTMSSLLHPVAPDGAEDPEHERVVERFDLVRNAGLDVQHFAVAQRHFVAGDEQLQRALQHVGHLLAVVRVLRHDGAALQIDLCDVSRSPDTNFRETISVTFSSAISSQRNKTIGLQC